MARKMTKCIVALLVLFGIGICRVMSERVVILHTNDTHSAIFPDPQGRGGVLQRKVVIDSIRNAENNVLLVDAGDAVQGSLYFKFFRGEVEYPLMDMMGYEIRTVGNHEFDNGLDELAAQLRKSDAHIISANYDWSATPMQGITQPYTITEIGGKRIGFVGVNVDPAGLIIADNYKGMKWLGVDGVIDSIAHELKHDKGCDVVVALTHIGYEMAPGKASDVNLAASSHDIDMIIGGHSHTLVDPAHPERHPYFVANADGRQVLVTQTGKGGRYVGKISFDTDSLGSLPHYELIPITDRFASELFDREMVDFITPYKEKVDSVNRIVVGVAPRGMPAQRLGRFSNWTADFGYEFGRTVGSPDLAIMNVGGIRQDFPAGDVSRGDVMSAFPFSNRMVLLRIKGSDLAEALSAAAWKGGEAVSSGVRVNGDTIIVDGQPLDPMREYVVATIDYLAWGNDDLDALARGEIIWSDTKEVADRILEYIEQLTARGGVIDADDAPRFTDK